MFAALDESAPELPSGIAYVLTGVVLLGEEVEARKAAQAPLGGVSRRQRALAYSRWSFPSSLAKVLATSASRAAGATPTFVTVWSSSTCSTSLADQPLCSYDWRNKSEALLWLADGVCGAVADYLLQAAGKTHYFETLLASKVIGELTYISEGAP